MGGLSLVAASGGHFSSRRAGLSLSRPLVAEHKLQTRRLSSCGSLAQLLRGMWDLPRPGVEPVFPVLAGRLSTTAPPGKPPTTLFLTPFCSYRNQGSEALNNMSKVTGLVNGSVRISSHNHCLLFGTPVSAPCQSLVLRLHMHNAMLSRIESRDSPSKKLNNFLEKEASKLYLLTLRPTYLSECFRGVCAWLSHSSLPTRILQRDSWQKEAGGSGWVSRV